MAQAVAWAVFIVPLLSLFLLDGRVVRRFLSVAFLVTMFNTIFYEVAWQHNWWRYSKSLFSWDKVTPVPLVFSGYWVATIWIFRYTFHKFWLYFVVNVVVDGAFVFVVAPLLKKFGIWSGNMSGGTMLAMMTAVSVTIYLYQKWYEGDLLEMTIGSRDKART